MNLLADGFWLKPYAQALAGLLFTMAVLLIRPGNANSLYTRAGVIYVLFILANSVILFFVENNASYFFISLLCSVVYLIAVSLLCSMFIRLLRAQGSGESAMVFLVIIYHPVALLLVTLAKWFFS